MKVFLLRDDQGRLSFFAEEPADDPEAEARGGWLSRKYHRWRRALHESERGAARWARQVWGWLQRFVGRDEPMLRRLRGTDVIELCHPPEMPGEEAKALWSGYLAGRARHHMVWAAVNGLVSPLTVLLAPLPGPNVVGYWFVYRAACHLLALLGIRKARHERTVTDCLCVDAREVPDGVAAGAAERGP